jgi:hypothetical protein
LIAAQNQTNQANEARFQQVTAEAQAAQQRFREQIERGLGELDNLGREARLRVQEGGEKRRGNITQDLVSRGLFNTTVLDQQRRQSFRDQERQQQAIDEQVGRARSGLIERGAFGGVDTSRLLIDSLLSRQDRGPDLNRLSSLIQQFTAGGGRF